MLRRVQLGNRLRYGIWGIFVAFAGVACATAAPSTPVTSPSGAGLPAITQTQSLPTTPAREQSPAARVESTASLPEPSPASQPASTATGGSEIEENPLALFRDLNPNGPKEANTASIYQLLEPDAIEPIYTPQIANPEDVELDLDDLIMGVSLNGESRAYPIRVLRFREIVNDEVGGVPILVTW